MQVPTIPHVLTINKKILALLASVAISGQIYAKDIPISESLSVSVVSNGKSVIEFPFDLASASPGDFKGSGGMPEVKIGKNLLEIDAHSVGSTEIIVYGYEHPIVMKLKFEDNGDKYLKFTKPRSSNQDVIELESNPHEEIITTLITALFNEKSPAGYSVVTKKVTGKAAGLGWDLVVEYQGNHYNAQTYKITNSTRSTVELYEEMFVSEGDSVFAVSIEAPKLKPQEATRVFIVRAAKAK